MDYITVKIALPEYETGERIRKMYGAVGSYLYKYGIHGKDGAYYCALNRKAAFKIARIEGAKRVEHIESRRIYSVPK